MSAGGRNILESTDYLVSNVLLPSGGLLTALLVGWRWSAPALGRPRSKGAASAGSGSLC
jgi:SNF family Na+-dependent transporter